MPYALTVDRKPTYLHVKVTGDNSPEAVAGYLADVRAACEQYDCACVLIEENLAGARLDTAQIFAIIHEASKYVWPIVRKIAFIDVNEGHDFASMQFAETVAVNRGVNIQVFASLVEAERWLA